MLTAIYIVLGVAAYLLAGYVTHILDRISSNLKGIGADPFGFVILFWPLCLFEFVFLGIKAWTSRRVPLAQKISDTIVARIEK